MVPSARLELAQLSPLPPQDSVSTNFTTTAAFHVPGLHEEPLGFCSPNTLEFTLILYPYPCPRGNSDPAYFEGINAAPEAGAAGTDAAEAGAVDAGPSSTLPPLLLVRIFPK